MREKEHQQVVWGYVAPKPAMPPANLEQVVEQALVEHLKFHTHDGMSLYVWGTPKVEVGGLYIYPISAVDEGTSLQIAQGLHEKRGLPATGEWSLLYGYPGAHQAHPVIQ